MVALLKGVRVYLLSQCSSHAAETYVSVQINGHPVTDVIQHSAIAFSHSNSTHIVWYIDHVRARRQGHFINGDEHKAVVLLPVDCDYGPVVDGNVYKGQTVQITDLKMVTRVRAPKGQGCNHHTDLLWMKQWVECARKRRQAVALVLKDVIGIDVIAWSASTIRINPCITMHAIHTHTPHDHSLLDSTLSVLIIQNVPLLSSPYSLSLYSLRTQP
jgi:hypothetical protein